MVYFWSETHLEIQHKFHWAEVWDDRAHKEGPRDNIEYICPL